MSLTREMMHDAESGNYHSVEISYYKGAETVLLQMNRLYNMQLWYIYFTLRIIHLRIRIGHS